MHTYTHTTHINSSHTRHTAWDWVICPYGMHRHCEVGTIYWQFILLQYGDVRLVWNSNLFMKKLIILCGKWHLNWCFRSNYMNWMVTICFCVKFSSKIRIFSPSFRHNEFSFSGCRAATHHHVMTYVHFDDVFHSLWMLCTAWLITVKACFALCHTKVEIGRHFARWPIVHCER